MSERRQSAADTAAAFRARYERRIGPAPRPEDGSARDAVPPTADPCQVKEVAAAASIDPAASPPVALSPDTNLCTRCGVRPAIPGRPGPYRCAGCARKPARETPTETCSRCGRQLFRSPHAHYIDGRRVCRRCDPRVRARDVGRARPPAATIGQGARGRGALAAEIAALRAETALLLDGLEGAEIERPRTRGECQPCAICEAFQASGIAAAAEPHRLLACGHRADQAANHCRPCPWVGCSKHLALDINPQNGSIRLAFPEIEPWELAETCSEDVAIRGGVKLDTVGALTNVSRQRALQIEISALLKLRLASPSLDELGARPTPTTLPKRRRRRRPR